MNSKKKCTGCKRYYRAETMITGPAGVFCDHKCAIAHHQRKLKKKEREDKREARKRKEELQPRSYWYNKLQSLVNQYVVHVRDKDQPCCTCGTRNDIKYDAGHFFTRAARPDIRFDLRNIHKQCSIRCNVYGSGMRAEYRDFILRKYGSETLEELEQEGPALKEQFPAIDDIKSEIARYRDILRNNGIKPRC